MSGGVLEVMDTDSRAISIVIDDCKSWDRRQKWLDHLVEHERARDTVANLLDAAEIALARLERTNHTREADRVTAALNLRAAIQRANGSDGRKG